MTKKHFIAIAALLDANRTPLPIVQDMADYLGEENVLFDRRRFIEAATINLRLDRASESLILSEELS